MSRSRLPPKSEEPEATVSELYALYREAAIEEPGPLLDRAILDAAQAAVAPVVKPARQRPRWRNWFAATSAIAVALLGLSLTWRVMDEQERTRRAELDAAPAVNQTAGTSAPVPAPTAATPSDNTAVSPTADSAARSSATRAAPTGSPASEAPAFPAAPAASAPLQESMQKSRRAEAADGREMRDSSTGSLGAPAPASRKLEVAAPEAWLQQIRELRVAGRGVEAAQSLARFRLRYPDFVLPDDLADLK